MRKIKSTLKILLRRVFSSLGFILLTKNRFDDLVSSRTEMLRQLSSLGSTADVSSEIKGIVFSRDRPLQLHAMLASYYDQVQPAAPLSILVSISDSGFQKAYDEVFLCFSDKDIDIVVEKDFKRDLVQTLEELNSRRVFFLVDDIVFIEPVDLEAIISFDSQKNIPSLRLGKNISYCYTYCAPQSIPQNATEQGAFITWKWSEGFFDWGYSYSVDGNIFLLHEILAIARVSRFKAPNSFEGALLMSKDLFSDRNGVCYPKSRLLNIPLNKTQTENDNFSAGGSPESLLEMWNDGFGIDFKNIYGINNVSPHQEVEVSFISRLN